jgi:ABC-type antimicrobial peptide transport system permease subunit
MVKNKMHSVINVAGLAIGMVVAIIIGLWIADEISFNRQYTHYRRIGQVIQNVTNNGAVETWRTVPWPLGDEIRKNYGADFSRIAMASFAYEHNLTIGEDKYSKSGMYVEPDFYEMFDVAVTSGAISKDDPAAILISTSTATAFFGEEEPIGALISMDGKEFHVAGVYRDFPNRSRWTDVAFLANWVTFIDVAELEQMDDPWRPNAFQLFVMLNEGASYEHASMRIKDAKLKKVNEALAKKKPELFIHGMADWHLHAEFVSGKQTGGLMQYVWMFGIVGVFVLIMACINFTNLSTARSEKRAREVGIRKVVGSYRSQLIAQFFVESVLTVFISLLFALVMVQLLLPVFNNLSEKNMSLPWQEAKLWIGVAFASIVVGAVAGSYPALYLSSIRPIRVLKGLFKADRGTSLPRQVLVVVQFSVSIILIIGTLAVSLQVRHGMSRRLGYDVNGLVFVYGVTEQVHNHFDAIRKTLIDEGAIVDMAESAAPPSNGWSSSSRIDWDGKDPDLSIDFTVFIGSVDYGKTIQWEILKGRDFSRDFPSDTVAVILNEAAAAYTEKEVIGNTLRSSGQAFTIVGVVRDVVYGDPFQPVRPALYFLSNNIHYTTTFRLNPETPIAQSVASIEAAIKPHMQGQPFSCQFIDAEQARKFGNEQRVFKLASIFAGLAVFISCLGIFGLSSFVAEQRTKEIGVRKVLGASHAQLWMLMSKDFVVLVVLSCLLATPLAYWVLQSWLEGYTYRINLPWWIFIIASIGTLAITMLAVSWHTIRAAGLNPATTLKVEYRSMPFERSPLILQHIRGGRHFEIANSQHRLSLDLFRPA